MLVVRSCAIGDLVLSFPALEAMAHRSRELRFTLVGYASRMELGRAFLPVEAIGSIDVPPWSAVFAGPQPGLEFDGAIVWMRDSTYAENLRRSGVPNVLHADPFPSSGHAAEHLLATVGMAAPPRVDRWHPGSDRIVLHPGSGGRAKRWPFFNRLGALLGHPLFLTGPAESGLDTPYDRLDGLGLPQVVRLLRHCGGYVGNDSGITQLAAYLGCPTVALFGPTDPSVWGPVGLRVRTISKASLRSTRPEEVMEALLPVDS